MLGEVLGVSVWVQRESPWRQELTLDVRRVVLQQQGNQSLSEINHVKILARRLSKSSGNDPFLHVLFHHGPLRLPFSSNP